jgi:hypothetical protein
MHAAHNIAKMTVPPRRHAIDPCAMASQPTSSVRSTATFPAHAMTPAQCHPKINSVWSATPFATGPDLLVKSVKHGLWVSRQSKLSNIEIENATRCVQTAAERARYPCKDTADAALPHVNWFTSGRKGLFLPVCRLSARSGP